MSYYKKGSWNSICDRCGFEFKMHQLRKDWQGLMVCREDWEPRHPQDFLRTRPEHAGVPIARPEPEDDNRLVCYMWDSSGYAGLAQAGCMIAGNNTYSASFLTTQKNEGS